MTQEKNYESVNTYRVGKFRDKITQEIIEDDAPVLCNKSYGYYAKITKNGIQSVLENQAEGEGDMGLGGMINPNQMMGNMWAGMDPNAMIMPDGLGGDKKRGKKATRKEREYQKDSRVNSSIDRRKKGNSRNDKRRGNRNNNSRYDRKSGNKRHHRYRH